MPNGAIQQRQAKQLAFVLVLAVLGSGRSAAAQSAAFVGAFTQVAHDGSLSTTPSGVVFAATTPPGAGIELRWATDATYKWLTASFLQLAPAPRRGKSFQPFGTIGAGVVYSNGDESVGLNISGGVATFLTDHIGVSLDYRYFRGRGSINGVEPVARTISLGAYWRF
jgi:hypothetical protein